MREKEIRAMILVSETYEIVTPESAEQGDFAETGFNFEQQEFGFRELVDYIRDNGFGEPSRFPVDQYTWISTVDPDCDYVTGDETTRNLHFAGPEYKRKYWFKAMRAAGIQ